MTEHEQTRKDQQPAPRQPSRQRRVSYCAALVLTTVVVTGGYYALRGATMSGRGSDGEEPQEVPQSLVQAPLDYTKWERPLVALVLTGQMHGYVDPCGCSSPQFGGLVRRYNFIETLKEKKWDVVGIDLGELPALQGIHAQNLLKFDLTIKALAAMNYRAFGIGKNEIQLGLGESLAQIYDDKRLLPRPLAMSLGQTGPKETYHDLNVRGYEIIGNSKPKIGVISMTGPDFRDRFKQEKWLNNSVALPKALKALADGGVEIGVILHHEYPTVDPNLIGGQRDKAIESARKKQVLECAQFCADARKKNPKIPPIQLIMMLVEEPEAPSFLEDLDPKLPTKLLEVGHKGKYVGLVGIYADGKKYQLKHQNVLMSEEWKTVAGHEDKNQVIKLMEKYHEELKRLDMLALFPRTPHFNQLVAPNQKGLRATYVGSESCKSCHQEAFSKWEKTAHAEATETLEKPDRPVGRNYDAECMKCHTTGFKHPGGYHNLIADLANWPQVKTKPDAKDIAKHNTATRGVGCESCHGPGSEHVARPRDVDLHKLINPYRPSDDERKAEEAVKQNAQDPKFLQALKQLSAPRMRAMNDFCTQCHNEENDVNWYSKGVAHKWSRIVHRMPAKNNNGAGNAPAKGANPITVNADPPIVIDVIENKK